MSEFPGIPRELSALREQGAHFHSIKNAISQHHFQATADRRAALKQTRPITPPWYDNAPQEQKNQLKIHNDALLKSQNEQDRIFKKTLKNIHDFARELLRPELNRLDANLDPDRTWLRLYAPKSLGLFGIKSDGFAVKTFSLLQAALHNFEAWEVEPGFFDTSSGFISQPDTRGHFDRVRTSLGIETFTRLCRTLDIGGKYQAYLKGFLRPEDPVARTFLQSKVTTHQKNALKAAAYMALVKKDIEQRDYELLLKVVAGQQKIMEGDKQVFFTSLSVMGLRLSDCMVFTPTVPHRYHHGYVIAYIPDDPEHPVKRYASFSEFEQELTRQFMIRPQGSASAQAALEPTDYQVFFSRFVAERDKSYYFSRFTEKASDGPPESFAVTWRRHELVRIAEQALLYSEMPGPPDRATRRDPIDNPYFYVRGLTMKGKGLWESFDLWSLLHDIKLDRLFEDARIMAVPTEDQDAKARSARWANYLNIGFTAVGVFAMFVPGLGEVMLVVIAGQLLSEVLEGAIELSEGDREAGWAHITDVIENVATAIVLAPVFHYTVSPFIEGLKPIKLPNGNTRLWKPDLEPYRFKGRLPENLTPIEPGVYRHAGKTLVQLDTHFYEVKDNSQTGRQHLQHPARTDGYQPALNHNGSGAYVLEGEQSRTWDTPTLLRRMGRSVSDLSEGQREEVRQASGTQPDELRRMYAENTTPPLLFEDTLTRLSIDNDVQTFIDQMKSADPAVYAQANPITQMHLMTRYGLWPDGVSMRIIDNQFRPLWEHTSSKAAHGRKLIVQLSERQLLEGKLLDTVMETLDANATSVILDQPLDAPRAPLKVRTRQLRQTLAALAQQNRAALFNGDYANRGHTGDKPNEVIKRQFPELPAPLIERLLTHADPLEGAAINDEERIPLRLKNIARELQSEVRATRASEGFIRDSLFTQNTERLVLGALRQNTDTFGDLRIEVRVGSVDGPLSSEAGVQDASTVRLLINKEPQRYEVRDAAHNLLHPADDFYESLLHALPDKQRRALGYRVGQGEFFKQWVMAKTEPPSVRRTLLAEPPVRGAPRRETLLLLRGGTQSREGKTLTERVQDLYPNMNPHEVASFVDSLNRHPEPIAAVEQLERELHELRVSLNQWRYRQPERWGPGGQNFVDGGGRYIARQLIKCFERQTRADDAPGPQLDSGYTLDLSSAYRQDINLGQWWKTLPELGKYLDKVTALNLDSTPFPAQANGLLKDFRNLRSLSARRCRLTALPEHIAQMHFLKMLRLSDNFIPLTAEHVQQLKDLTRLEVLRLDNNPLGRAPDVGRMPALRELTLFNTNIDTWPEGLRAKPRPRGFFLDMRFNAITRIPQVVPGSDDAFIVARTRLNTMDLSEPNRLRYENYRTSVGIPRRHAYNTLAENAREKWPRSKDSGWWGPLDGQGVARPEAWSDLGAEPGSTDFFTVIDSLTQSADYRADGEARQQLSSRVWLTIDAMDLNPGLREKLFAMASTPATCADAGAQLFNNMGVQVLAAEAHAFSTSNAVLETKLVTLARGAARLERVNEIARADIQARGGNPDDVEVYLAYQTSLAQRLDLPWQSQQMLFRTVAGVSEANIEQAFETVTELEEGNGLVDSMNERDFWINYLNERYPSEFRENEALYQTRSGLLTDLITAQREWVASEGLSTEQRTALQDRLKVLADRLSMPHEEVFNDQPMSLRTEDRLNNEMYDQEKHLSRRLTHDALKKAGL
ncbi:NEL-type E3 ubiquitin ligase domain-containing protein [Pseudomonas sp. NPDC087697]|uniref:NEL-type E3 ubiquitin ligase domain-containing protein n=1 Tax=Pseudomonas sp. NPDC087697 TaxID=3364447 RepID=UPI0037FEC263